MKHSKHLGVMFSANNGYFQLISTLDRQSRCLQKPIFLVHLLTKLILNVTNKHQGLIFIQSRNLHVQKIYLTHQWQILYNFKGNISLIYLLISLIFNINKKMIKVVIALLLMVLLQSFVIEYQNGKKQDTEGLMKLKKIVRNIDGSGNNVQHPDWGKSYINLLRTAPVRYQDGKSQLLSNLPNPRFLSNTISKLEDNKVIPNEFNLTMLWGTWGQFLDHDMSHSFEGHEPSNIPVPRCDPQFDPKCTGIQFIQVYRTAFDQKSQVREIFNRLTAWIDASMVYGSTLQVSQPLRALQRGKLRTSPGQLLPIKDGSFIAGDLRATQNMGLTALQILFMREHNRLCDVIYNADRSLSDEEIFNIARNYVIGLIQKISFYDYLPNLFGKENYKHYIGDYKGYNASINPSITTEFSSTAYRIGHPYVPNTYKAVNNDNETVEMINLLQLLNSSPEKLTYFRNNYILKGLSFTLAKERTSDYVDEIRSVPLYILPGHMDLFSINVFRNRDHGVSDYNTLRQVFGLKKYTTFDQIFEDQGDRDVIEKSFISIDNIDSYVGILGQKKLQNSMFGQLGATIGGIQFSNIRNGDRFWFQGAFPAELIKEIKETSITDIINRNTDIQDMPLNPFFCNDCSVD